MLPLLLLALSPIGLVLAPSAADGALVLGVDARMSLIVSDDNLAVGSGFNSSAGLITAPAARLSFDDVDRQDVAYERDLRLMLFAEAAETGSAPGFFVALLPRLSLAQPNSSDALVWSDTSTFLGVHQSFAFGGLTLVAFPWSTEQVRLGFTNGTSWALGSRLNRNLPGARLEWTGWGGYGFVAGKAGAVQMDQSDGTKDFDTTWSVVSGVGWRLFDAVNADLEGAYALRGTIDKQELRPATGAPPVYWRAWGGAARLAWSDGLAVSTPVGYAPLDNDLFLYDSLMADAEPPREVLDWSVVGTATLLWQDLQDPAVPAKLTSQRALAAGLTAAAKYDRLSVALLGTYRDLSSILFDVPSSPSFVAFSDSMTVTPETRLAARASLGWLLGGVETKAEVTAGIRWPASMTATSIGEPPTTLVLVFYDEANVQILDGDEKARPVPEARLSLQARLNEWTAAVVDLLGSWDRNQRTFRQDNEGIPYRTVTKPGRFGVNFLLRARL